MKRAHAEIAPDAAIGTFLRSVIHEEIGAVLDEKIPQYLASLQRQAARPAAPVESVYLTREQAAEMTGYSVRTIARRIASGAIAASGPRLDRIKRSEIERMMALRPKRAATAATSEDAEIDAAVDRMLGE